MLDLLVGTIIVSSSGALSPGPLTACAAALGARRGGAWEGARAGLLVALGHMAFELPYVLALAYVAPLLAPLERPLAAVTLASAGFFAWLTARDGVAALRGSLGQAPSARTAGSPLAAGVAFTALNPYFLAWWATVGLPLVVRAASLGALGIAAMYAAHVWMDFAWLALMAGLGGGASAVLGRRYGYLLLALAALLLLFGVNVALRAFAGFSLF